MNGELKCIVCGATVHLKRDSDNKYVLSCCGDVAVHDKIDTVYYLFDKLQLKDYKG